jgi:hypothetical protein
MDIYRQQQKRDDILLPLLYGADWIPNSVIANQKYTELRSFCKSLDTRQICI